MRNSRLSLAAAAALIGLSGIAVVGGPSQTAQTQQVAADKIAQQQPVQTQTIQNVDRTSERLQGARGIMDNRQKRGPFNRTRENARRLRQAQKAALKP